MKEIKEEKEKKGENKGKTEREKEWKRKKIHILNLNLFYSHHESSMYLLSLFPQNPLFEHYQKGLILCKY
jgi:hypothetical protein